MRRRILATVLVVLVLLAVLGALWWFDRDRLRVRWEWDGHAVYLEREAHPHARVWKQEARGPGQDWEITIWSDLNGDRRIAGEENLERTNVGGDSLSVGGSNYTTTVQGERAWLAAWTAQRAPSTSVAIGHDLTGLEDAVLPGGLPAASTPVGEDGSLASAWCLWRTSDDGGTVHLAIASVDFQRFVVSAPAGTQVWVQVADAPDQLIALQDGVGHVALPEPAEQVGFRSARTTGVEERVTITHRPRVLR